MSEKSPYHIAFDLSTLLVPSSLANVQLGAEEIIDVVNQNPHCDLIGVYSDSPTRLSGEETVEATLGQIGIEGGLINSGPMTRSLRIADALTRAHTPRNGSLNLSNGRPLPLEEIKGVLYVAGEDVHEPRAESSWENNLLIASLLPTLFVFTQTPLKIAERDLEITDDDRKGPRLFTYGGQKALINAVQVLTSD